MSKSIVSGHMGSFDYTFSEGVYTIRLDQVCGAQDTLLDYGYTVTSGGQSLYVRTNGKLFTVVRELTKILASC